MAINPSWDEITQREDYQRLSPEGKRRLQSNFEAEQQKAQAGREASPQTVATETVSPQPEAGTSDPTRRFKPLQAAMFGGRQLGRQALSTVQGAMREADRTFGSPQQHMVSSLGEIKGEKPRGVADPWKTLEGKIGEFKDEYYPSADKDRYKPAEGMIAKFGEDVISTATQQIPQYLSAFATGGGSLMPALGIGATQMYGAQYDQLAEEVGHEKATMAATAQASLNSVFESFGLGKVVSAWKGKGPLMDRLVNWGEAALAEGVTEFMQKYPEYVMDIWAKSEGKTDAEVMDEFTAGLVDATKEGLYEGLLGATVGGGAAVAGTLANDAIRKVQGEPDLTQFGFTQQFQDNFKKGDIQANEISTTDLLRMKQTPELMERFGVDETFVNESIVAQFDQHPEAQEAVVTALESDVGPEFIAGIARGLGLNDKGAGGTEFLYQEPEAAPATDGAQLAQAQADLRRAFKNNELSVPDLIGLRNDDQVMEQYGLDKPSVDAVIMEHFEDTYGAKQAIPFAMDLGIDPNVVAKFGEEMPKLEPELKGKKPVIEESAPTGQGANVYFHSTAKSETVPIEDVLPRNEILETEATEEKGALAARLMDEAAADPDNLGKKRKPLEVVTRPDGKRVIADGNTTWHELKRRGETQVEVVEAKPHQSVKNTPNEAALREAATKALPEADSFVQGWAEKLGAKVKARSSGLKKQDTTEKKIRDKYKGRAWMATDVIAQTLVFDTDAELLSALEQLKNDPKVVTWESRYDKPLASGYRDVSLDVRLSDGHVMELQLNTQPMMDTKKSLHGLYSVVRNVGSEAGLSRLDKAQLNTLLDEMMRKGYAAAAALSTVPSASRTATDEANFKASLSSTLEASNIILSFMSGADISSKLSPDMRKILAESLNATKGALSDTKKILSPSISESLGTETTSTVGVKKGPSAPTISTQAAEVNTYEGLRKQVSEVIKSPRQVDAFMGLIAARAASAGVTPDEYVASRGLQVEQTSMRKAGIPLRQKAKGAFDLGTWRREGKAIIKAFEAADISTLAHEIGHLFRQDLQLSKNARLLKTAEKWAGVKDGKWEVEHEEKFARAFERYLRTGNAPTQEIQSVFDVFKQWLTRIYKSITGSPLDVKMHPDIVAVFDQLLTVQGALDSRAAVDKLLKKDPRLKVQVSKLDNNMAGGLEYNEDTNQLNFHPVKGALSVAQSEMLFQGVEKPGKGGRILRGRASKQSNVGVVAAMLDTSAVMNEWDQSESISEAEAFADNISWLKPNIKIEKKTLRWKDAKEAKGYKWLGKFFYGNDKMAFPNSSYPKGRNTYDIPGCGREAWANNNGILAKQACYGSYCYAERLKVSKQGTSAGITGGMNKIGVSGKKRAEVLSVFNSRGLDRARKEFPEYEFVVVKADSAFKKKIAETEKKTGKPPTNAIKEADGQWQKLTIGYYKNAKGEIIPFNELSEQEALAAVVSTNLQPADGADIRLGVDTDGSAWLADKKVMDALMKANPRTLTVYSSAYHTPPPKHALSGRTIINVTVSGWHPLPETLSRIKWAEKARANGWNVILREVVADPETFVDKKLVEQYNRIHDAIMATDFFIMEQPLHIGDQHGKPFTGLPSCCIGSETNVHTCDQCETSEGLGIGFQEYWEIHEEPDSDEIVMPDSTYEGRQILLQEDTNVPWKADRGERGQTYRKLDPKDAPKKTRTAYKLMRIFDRRPGAVFPLYARPEDGKAQGFTAGEWFAAESQQPKGLANRPGIHAVALPVFDQGKAKVKGEKRVWAEVELPAVSQETQTESDDSPLLPNGMRSGITQRLIGPTESYDFKTNPSASLDAAGWPIAGSAKIVRILGDEEVADILRKNDLDYQIENSTTGYTNKDAAEMGNWLDPELLLQAEKGVGIHINDMTQPFTEQILDGKKTIETRTNRNLDKFIGQRVGIIRTGKGKATVVGTVEIGKPKVYRTEEAFRKDEDKHLVKAKSKYYIDKTKYGYPLKNPARVTATKVEGFTGNRTYRPVDQRLLLQTDTKKFGEWFKDSVIVNDDGSPRIMYHGSKRSFRALRSAYSHGMTFFSMNPEFAGSWVKGSGGLRANEPETQPYLDEAREIERELGNKYFEGFDMDHNDPQWVAEYDKRRALVQAALKKEIGYERAMEYEDIADAKVYPVYLSVQKLFDPQVDYPKIEKFLRTLPNGMAEVVDKGYHKRGNWVVYEVTSVVEKLKSMGYDGLLISENLDGPHETVAIFEPTQAKSIFNQGGWDPKDPDLLLQADTPEFKKWFKESAVVKDDGTPMKVFHASKKGFDAFRPAISDLGSHFAADPRQSNAVVGTEDADFNSMLPRARTYPVYLSIQNPLRLEDKGYFTVEYVMPQLADHGLITDEQSDKNILEFSDQTMANQNKQMHKILKMHGYDGVSYLNRREGLYDRETGGDWSSADYDLLKNGTDEEILEQFEATEAFIVFDPEQVKSVFNRGSWDPKNPDFLLQSEEGAKLPEFMLDEFLNNGDIDAKQYQKYSTEIDALYAEYAVPGSKKWFDPWELLARQVRLIRNIAKAAGREDILDSGLLYQAATPNDDIWGVPETDTRWQTLRWKIQDKLDPLRRVQELLPNLDSESDVYRKESLRAARTQAAMDEYQEDVIQPLLKEIADSKYDLELLEKIAYAMHAPEANARLRLTNARRYLEMLLSEKRGEAREDLRASIDAFDETAKDEKWSRAEKQQELLDLLERSWGNTKPEKAIKKHWDSRKDRLSGMSDASAESFLRSVKNKPEAIKLAEKIQQLTEMKIDLLVDAGVLSKDEAAAWRQYKHYVPLQREGFEDEIGAGTGSGISSTGAASKMRAGSLRRATNILANIVADYEKALDRAGRAEAARALLKLAQDNPNPDFWEVNKSKKEPYYDSEGNVRLYSTNNVKKDYEIALRVDGEQWIVRFNKHSDAGKRIAQALNGSGKDVGNFVNGMGAITRYLAMLNTSLSPEFIVSNFFRDIQTALINIDSTEAKKIEAKVLKDVRKSGLGIWRASRGDKESEWSQIWQDYKKHGGKVTWMSGHDSPGEGTKQLEAKIKALSEGKANFISMQSARDLLKVIEDVNTAVENAVRLSFYKHAVDAGVAKDVAALAAKELTTNFERKGAAGPTLNAFYMFANAGIQGSTRIFKALKHSNKAKVMVGSIAITAFVTSLFNRFVGGDDEDDKAYYDKIPDHIKERNMIFMIPGSKGKFGKIPMPWGYNIFWILGDQTAAAMTDPDYNARESAVYTFVAALNAFNPLQAATWLQTLAPTILDPVAQIAENKSWSGTPNKPTPFPGDRSPDPRHLQHWDSAKTPWKMITKALNNLTGGDEVHSGLIDISPEDLDVFWDTFTGSAGRFLMNTFDIPLKLAKGEGSDIGIKDIPFVRRVAGEQSETTNRTLYFENLKPVAEVRKRLKLTDNKAEERAIKERYPAEVSLLPALKSSDRQLRKLRKERTKLKDAEAPKAEIDAVNDKMDKVYLEFNKKYYSKMRN